MSWSFYVYHFCAGKPMPNNNFKDFSRVYKCISYISVDTQRKDMGSECKLLNKLVELWKH